MASRGGGRGGGGRGGPGGRDGNYDGRGRGYGGGRGGGRGGYQQQQYGRGDGGGRGPPPGVVGRGGGGRGYQQQQPYGRGDGGGRGPGGRGGGERVPPTAAAPHPVAPPPAVFAAPPPSDAAAAAAAASALGRDVRAMALSDTAPPAAGSQALAPPEPIPLSSKGIAHPPRPGFGTVGRRVVVRANHFLATVADNDICHYDVAMNPEPKSRRTNRVVISELIRMHRQAHLGGISLAYDGSKSLYTAAELPFTSMDFAIKLGRGLREIEHKVTIRLVGRANVHHMQEFIAGRQRDSPQDTIQALDVVLRESPSQKYVTVSRSFFSTVFGHKDIGEGLECWKGYYQSLRPTQMGLSLNIDTSSTAFFKRMSLIEYVVQSLKLDNPDPRRPLSDMDRLMLKKALRGVRVETTHQQGKTSTYKITGITSAPLSQLTFTLNEAPQTVLQYFSLRYKYKLQYTSWPCLQSGKASDPIFLPMEVCTIIEGQRYSKKLSNSQVTNILRATCMSPEDREKGIIQRVQDNNYQADVVAREFGIAISNQMVHVPARVLPAPRLKYHESGRMKTCDPSIGKWNMIDKKVVSGGRVQFWTCLNFSRKNITEVRRIICGPLVDTCNDIGMVFHRDPVIEIRSATPKNIEAALNDVHSRAPALQLLIVILPDANGYYGRIKKVCETELGIVSQCLKPCHQLTTANKQYLENVSLKINVKVGGRNTVLERHLVPLVTDCPTMIFGADVTHPSPGEDSSASIAAVVASMDWPEITKYRAFISAQPPRQEIIQDLFKIGKDENGNDVLGGMIRESLFAFYRNNGRRKPERIIFYRDGVSEGQFYQVLLYELDAITKAFASMESEYRPKVTFVVVQKRHHTRLFPEVRRPDLMDKSGNILPGTVVDSKICHPSEFDFYLCSHAGIQGTSRPTHYHVLHDENHFTADQLQMLTNNLCYTYARCTRAVSVVPPAYYAHLAAFRARHYIEPAEGSLDDQEAAGQPAAVRQLPQIKGNVNNVMFFC